MRGNRYGIDNDVGRLRTGTEGRRSVVGLLVGPSTCLWRRIMNTTGVLAPELWRSSFDILIMALSTGEERQRRV